MPPPLPTVDLEAILAATAPLWPEIRNQRLFLTGGTGFFGCWLVESFLHANAALGLNAELTILTRNPEAFLRKLPHLRNASAPTLLEGDVRTFAFPPGAYEFVIHAATEASARQLAEAPDEMRSTIVAGTGRVLAFAAQAATRKLLFISSGAVYGRQPPDLTHIPEDTPPHPETVYGEAKLTAEKLCADAPFDIKIARCFAFLGPHLPVDTHFAAGNFLADALAQRPIRIASDGSAIRSYLYAADLAIWLWTILFRGQPLRPCNVGSEEAVTIRQLAETAAGSATPAVPVLVAQPSDPSQPPHRYIPATLRAQTDLGLRQTVSLQEGFLRTIAWHTLK
jgi:dTDP-glucose 4,6-dehydratase